MKIAYIFSQFPVPSEVFASNDVLELTARGHEVAAYGLRPLHKRSAILRKERGLTHIAIEALTTRKILSGMLLISLQPILFFRLLCWITKNRKNLGAKGISQLIAVAPLLFFYLRDIAEKKFDVVHIFWGHFPAALCYLLKARNPNVIVTMFLGAYDLVREFGISFAAAHLADHVFTHSLANIESLLSAGLSAERLSVVYRGFPVEKYSGQVENIEKERRSIISVGRLIGGKGFLEVLQVMLNLKARGVPCILRIAGDGPQRDSLERFVATNDLSDYVQFLGHLSHVAVLQEMARSEIFLFLSTHESERLPNVVKEAMFCRCVCIVSDTPGISELISHEGDGYIVPAKDLSKIIDVVAHVLEGTDDARLVDSAHQTIRDKFDVAVSMENYMRIWRQRTSEIKRRHDR